MVRAKVGRRVRNAVMVLGLPLAVLLASGSAKAQYCWWGYNYVWQCNPYTGFCGYQYAYQYMCVP